MSPKNVKKQERSDNRFYWLFLPFAVIMVVSVAVIQAVNFSSWAPYVVSIAVFGIYLVIYTRFIDKRK